MTTYRLLNNMFDYHAAYVDFRLMRRQFNSLKVWFNQDNESLNEKLKDQWTPVGLKFESDRKANSNPDLSVWNNSCLVLSSKAKDKLFSILKDKGEFFPLEQDYFLYNCLESVSGDAVDPEKTKMDLETVDSAHIPKELAFLPKKIKGKVLFKPAFAHNGFLICQDEFKQIVEDNNLGGLQFNANLGQIFPVK